MCEHYLKLFKLVLIVIGVYINIIILFFYRGLLTFTNQTVLQGGDYLCNQVFTVIN